jgi:hypothetical protein
MHRMHVGPRVHHAGRLLALALALVGCSDLGVKVKLEGRAEVSPASVDFGTLALNDLATRTVTVRNTGNADLTGNASLACPPFAITAGGGPFTLAPGGAHDVVLSFNPTADGTFACTLDLGPQVPGVALSGIGSPQPPGAAWNVVPASLSFDPILVGQTFSKSFEIFSTGTAPLTVDVVLGTCGDYVLLSGGGPATVPPGSSVVVNVSFNPQTPGTQPCHIAVGPGIPDVGITGTALVSYSADIQPIFNNFCISCHPPNNQLNLNAGVSLSNLVNRAAFGYPGHIRVVPGDPANSVLYNKVANTGVFGGPMPQGSSGLAAPLVDKIRNWILQGASNN